MVFSKIIINYNNLLSEKLFFIVLLTLCVFNIAGSLPSVANLVIEEHYVLIAWLHFIFLGIYVPFVWIELKVKNVVIWALYAVVFLFSQLILLFPSTFFIKAGIAVPWLLFYAYLGVFICFCFVHLPKLVKKS